MFVVDSSAVIAMIKQERPTIDLQTIVPQASVTSIHSSEVVDRFARDGKERAEIESMIDERELEVIALGIELAYTTGMLRPQTSAFGLSIGDRFCLALAMRLGYPLVTTDKDLFDCASSLSVVAEFAR